MLDMKNYMTEKAGLTQPTGKHWSDLSKDTKEIK